MANETYDLLVKGGMVVDGSGGEPFRADVAVRGRKIVKVGTITGDAAEVIDATGCIVTPGFVDIHTHYDGQVTWQQSLSPSSNHGVTTVVIGNCGIGFAPCKAEDREGLVHLMEGVEDLPEAVLTTGLPWSWESFPDYLDFLEGRSFDMDVAAYLPHSALRVFVMGQRAVDREPATDEDRKQMAKLAREAMDAGAVGFATSRTINHKSSTGDLVPTLKATEDELTEIAKALGSADKGVLQVVSDFDDVSAETDMLRRVASASGRPLTLSLFQVHGDPDRWRKVLGWIEQCTGDGLPIKGQVAGRPVGALMGFELTFNPFGRTAEWQRLAELPLDERRKALHDPAVRARILEQAPLQDDPLSIAMRDYEWTFALGSNPNYEPLPEDSVARRAERAGVTPAEIIYDAMLENNAQGMLLKTAVNYKSGSLNEVSEMLRHQDTLYGLGDGGAHLGFLCDASLPTTLLTHWTRDRTRGPKLPLADVIHGLARKTALAVGLPDRGLIAEGMKADINVIDIDGLEIFSPQVNYDLPAGGRRLMQRAQGYVATVVSGVVTQRFDEPTGAYPGQLVRA